MPYKIDTPQKNEYPALLAIWESSVRATHTFVVNEEIEVLKGLIQEQKLFENSAMTIARDVDNTILGFMGVSENSLDMIFLDPRFINKGVGKMLIKHAIDDLGITKVDVNEQNEHALRFYEHFGFKVISRSPLDSNGKPYPILHMQLQQ